MKMYPNRRKGLAYLADAESEAFSAVVADTKGQAIDLLCGAQDKYARGCVLVEPINPETEKELLDRQKAVGKALVDARAKIKKRIG